MSDTTIGTAPLAAAPVDGRSARRERGRRAVIDAVLALALEGAFPPPVEEVARRSGVSVTSVFRYFDTLDDLNQATIDAYFATYAAAFEIPLLGQGDRTERIRRLVTARLDLYEATAPIAQIARTLAGSVPVVGDNLDDRRRHTLDQLRAHLAPERERLTRARAEQLVASVDVWTSFESWDLLTRVHRRTRRQVRSTWIDGLEAIIPS